MGMTLSIVTLCFKLLLSCTTQGHKRHGALLQALLHLCLPGMPVHRALVGLYEILIQAAHNTSFPSKTQAQDSIVSAAC